MPVEHVTPTATEPINEDDSRRGQTTLHRLIALAHDPTLIAGVHETCDQWCMYCPVTNRCLAFRCTTAGEQSGVWDLSGVGGEGVGEGIMFLKTLADAERRLAPPEIEAVLSRDRERLRKVFTLDDPLERIGRSYMMLAEACLHSRTDFPPEIVWRPSGATPLEVLTWYHTLVPARVFRAILCAAEARNGVPGRHRDARAAAKIALVGIDRSLTALAAVGTEDDDPRLELLEDRLHRLRDAVESRFPDAREFIRPGLDEEVAWWLRGLRHLRTLLHLRHERSAFDSASGDLR